MRGLDNIFPVVASTEQILKHRAATLGLKIQFTDRLLTNGDKGAL